MRPLLLLLLVVISVVNFSCKKGKLKTPTASYVVVNTTAVATYSNVTVDSHKITDIWLYVNEEFQGVFPIGSVMPIIANGTATVKMYAGIMNNGISSTRLPYKFYNAYEYTAAFEENKTYTITPTFNYIATTKIVNDEFSVGSGSSYMSTGAFTYTTTNDPAKAWGGSGQSVYMTMTDLKPNAIIKSSSHQALPVGGTDVYLELDYNCNQEITVGLICGGGIEERTAVTLRATNGWNKVYISLTNAVSGQPNYTYYEVFIKAEKQVATPEIYLDNIRLIKP